MSKKHRRQKQRRNFPWLLAALGGLLLLAAVFLFRNTDTGTPAVSVDKERIDYGEVKLNTPLTFSIVVTNTGDGILRFKEKPYIEVREGC
jgi:hypothetical protein